MKKLILLAIAVVLVIAVNAQPRFGIKAGGNISNLFESDDNGASGSHGARFGFHAGFMAEFPFANHFAIQPELLFMHNGTDMKSQGSTANVKMNFIQAPVNFKYKFGPEQIKFFVMGGPYFGYAVSGKLKNSHGNFDIYGDEAKSLDWKRFDFGIGAGIGLEVSKFVFGLTSQYGITSITGMEGVTANFITFQFSVGYFF
ncbi:MAG: PorT family protein [Prevotellaceae bacterium]|jgi:hypothetical protein|nr:PorT family protein [Prevotellaceae bacterium]